MSSTKRRFALTTLCVLSLSSQLVACKSPDGVSHTVPVESCLPRMEAAPARGEKAAFAAELRLSLQRSSARASLTSCSVYELTDLAPVYLGQVAEGNVAPWGTILAATGAQVLSEQLLDASLDGEWEYSLGYGPTAADTAMVLEGLWVAGVPPDVLVKSLTRLNQRYFQPASGGFASVRHPRARYWEGASIETTAHIAFLMHEIAPHNYSGAIARARDFVVSRQRRDGGWNGRWFPSQVMATFHAIRLLSALGGHQEELRRATSFLQMLARSDGSVAGSIIDTSLAVIASSTLERAPAAIESWKRWLRTHTRECSRSEPILYYWIETDNKRWFFSCSDRGGIAQAWAARALAK